MKMTVFDPFALARRMRDFDDLDLIDWDDTEIDMYEEDDKVVVKVKAPGFNEKNVNITVEDNSLTITGTAEEKEEEKNKKYYRKEITHKSFTRTISLPSKVVAEQAKAEFNNGILEIELPKAEESKPKKVQIKAEKSSK